MTGQRARFWQRAARVLALVVLALTGAFGFVAAQSPAAGGLALALRLDGAVSPATADYVSRGLDEAAARGAMLVILQMDTPGGLDTSMREIIRAILASPVPVASYVAPSGARAASAGTYIMYASHIAAMAPGTNLGAATPIALGGGGLPFGGGEEPDDDGKEPGDGNGETPQSPANPAEAKAVNDAVAYIRGLAELRDRNVDWAERAVREAASLSASAAAAENVIDFTAISVDDLLDKAQGRTVRVGQADTTLDTGDLVIEELDPDWRTRFLAVITNPNVALILMMVGIYGLIFEFLNPGAMVPGTIGAISLLIGLYALAVLPVSYAGAGLMLLGIGLIIAEAFAPSFGILGIGGTLALVLGATILFDTDVPGLRLSWPVIGAVGVTSLALSLVIVNLAFASRRRKVVSGAEQLIGAVGNVESWSGNSGYVFVQGERWQATSQDALEPGQEARVTGRTGLELHVTARSTHEAWRNGQTKGEP
jgi:membrane-bound serine protease (ClpP class)